MDELYSNTIKIKAFHHKSTNAIKRDITTGKARTVHDTRLTATELDKPCDIDKCNRLTDTEFYRRLNEDITATIQKRVTFYVNRVHKDLLITDETKQ